MLSFSIFVDCRNILVGINSTVILKAAACGSVEPYCGQNTVCECWTAQLSLTLMGLKAMTKLQYSIDLIRLMGILCRI